MAIQMADVPAHQRKARHNEKFFSQQSTIANCIRSYPDWCITALYYAAVQYVDAELAKQRMHPQSHGERDPMVANNLSRTIGTAYFFLQGRSVTARYFPDSEKGFSEQNVRECIDKLLEVEPNTSLQRFSSKNRARFQ
jgi:hypothetical protein